MDNINELIERLSDEQSDAVKKMAVFKLQSSIGDPSFAEVFISYGGLEKLRDLSLNSNGNTLAYALTSFSRLLELDRGWDYVSPELITRVVELIVTHPLVNILRGAMSILVAIVSHPHMNPSTQPYNGPFGFRALKPAIEAHTEFLEMLVNRLSSADHALCANSLQLINALMRDAITNDADTEWPRFIKKLQDLGVIKAVFVLMQSTALQDMAHPLLEFQALTKVLLRKWREVKVDLEVKEHRIALKGLHLASDPTRRSDSKASRNTRETEEKGSVRKKNPEKWRRLGFETESPAWEFGEVGFLGMMDLTDFVRKDEDGFRKLILEQSAKPAPHRCPVAKSSLAVTAILYHQFEVDKSNLDDPKAYQVLESRTNYDRAFRPLLLQWSRLHTAALNAFLRLWRETRAETGDFPKVAELVRVLVHETVGTAPRTKDVLEVEEEIATMELSHLRTLQMQLIERTYESAWGNHLSQVRDELQHEALQFVKEQRIRSLLSGAWFPSAIATHPARPPPFRFVRLSHNRRYLHFAEYDSPPSFTPKLEELAERIDLSAISSVTSNNPNFTPPQPPPSSSSTNTSGHRSKASLGQPDTSPTVININHYSANKQKEVPLLQLFPKDAATTSEWLDGLLMLMGQKPVTGETERLVGMVTNYGLKIRMLNVRYDERFNGTPLEKRESEREGVDNDYYYSLY